MRSWSPNIQSQYVIFFFLILLTAFLSVAPNSSAQTISTVTMTDTAVVSNNARPGLNLDQPSGSYPSFKNYYAFSNPGFEPIVMQQIYQFQAPQDTSSPTSFRWNVNNAKFAGYDQNQWAGATFTVVQGSHASGKSDPALGCTGTVKSSTIEPGAGPIFVINSATNQGSNGCAGELGAPGQVIVVSTNNRMPGVFPTPSSVWTSATGRNGSPFSFSSTGGATISSETDDLCPTCGQQSLRLTIPGGGSARLAGGPALNTPDGKSITLNGTYTMSFWAKSDGPIPPKLTVTLTPRSGSACTEVFSGTTSHAITSTWTQFSFNCSFAETPSGGSSTPFNTTIVATTTTGAPASLEFDNVSFTNTADTNPTVYSDAFVDAVQSWCQSASNTTGPQCTLRYSAPLASETMSNWVKQQFEHQPAIETYTSLSNAAGSTRPGIYDFLNLCAYVGATPVLTFPDTATTADVQNLVDFLEGSNSSTYGNIRASLGQMTPWVGASGSPFRVIYLEFGNKSWNTDLVGHTLGSMQSASIANLSYDYAVRAGVLFGAARAWQSSLGYSQAATKWVLNLAPFSTGDEAPALRTSRADAGEVNGGTASNIADFRTAGCLTGGSTNATCPLYGPALTEAWANTHDAGSQFYQSVSAVQRAKVCGPSGTAACQAMVYDENADSIASSTSSSAAFVRSVPGNFSKGGFQGVVAADQMGENDAAGVANQNSFMGLPDSLQIGANAPILGSMIDAGGDCSMTNSSLFGGSYCPRPQMLGTQVYNWCKIGPMVQTSWASNPTYNLPANKNGVKAISNVPVLHSFAFKQGNERCMVIVNTDVYSAHTITFFGANAPANDVTTYQFAPPALASTNEGIGVNDAGAFEATMWNTTTPGVNVNAGYSLPPHSVTAFKWEATGSLSGMPPVAAAPTFSPSGGDYESGQVVTISSPTAGTTIYYTTDGTLPNTSSPRYTGPITVSSAEAIQAIAVATGFSDSSVAMAAYNITMTGSTRKGAPARGRAAKFVAMASDINFPSGFASSQSQIQLMGAAHFNGSALQLTGLTSQSVAAAWYTNTVNVQSFTNDFTFQLTSAVADGFTFTIQNNNCCVGWSGINSVGYSGGNLGYAPDLNNSVAVKFDLYNNAGEGPDSTGLYTNGAIPTVPALDMTSSGVDLHSGDIMAVHMVYDGTTLTMTITNTVTSASYSTSWTIDIPATVGGNTAYIGFTASTGGSAAVQDVLTWTYSTSATPALPAPTFSVAAGNYPSAQTVAISDATSGTTIYYTTDGTTPTISSTPYTGAITVSSTETLEAMAVETGYPNSSVATAAYTINNALPAPAFSVAAGTYTSAKTVAISDATSGTTIYYTTNGTTPTTSSTKYTGAITVSSTETLEAMAVKTGYANSPAATAAYTISSAVPAPTFSLPPGTYANSQVTITDSLPGATIYYTNNGTTPTTSSKEYTVPVVLNSSGTFAIEAIAVANGVTSPVATVVYTIHPTVAMPTFSPAAGSYSSPQSVTINDVSTNAKIYYTTDGSTPTPSSAVYSGPVRVASTETINAIASMSGFTYSPVATAAYTISSTLPAPTFSVAPGTYTASQSVTISDATAGTTIYYTTDGSTPTTSSSKYKRAITVSSTETLQAIAVETGYTNSPVATADYTISSVLPAPTFSVAPGTYTASQSVSISDATAGTTIYYTTNGSTPTTSSWKYTGAITVSSTETLQAIAVETGYTDSPVATADYTISPVLPAPTFSSVAGIYIIPLSVTISDAVSGTTIYYTTDGTTPTTSSAKYTGAIVISLSQTLQAIAVKTGYTNSPVATADYTISPALPAPTFSVAPGDYTAAQSVTISDATAGTTIYYTTNGSTPTTSSSVYTGAITVSSTETLQAIAVETGYTNSPVATAAYTISTSGTTGNVISFPSGFAAAGSKIRMPGGQISGSAMELTDGTRVHQVGAGWYTTQVNVQSFTTDFTFQFPAALPDGGVTFCIQNFEGSPGWDGTSTAGWAEYLGYARGDIAVAPSVAIRFSTQHNDAGVSTNVTGLLENGAVPFPAGTDLTSSGILLGSGHIMAVHIVYDSTTLTVTLTDTVTKAAFTTTHTINIPQTVGNTAYVGFTGGTNSAAAQQNILTWSYSN